MKGGSPAIATEITRDTYDQGNAGYFNVGRLTTAWRGLTTANGVCTGTPTAKIERRFDYNTVGAGRPAQVYINPTEAPSPGVDRTLAFEYWPERLAEAQAACRCELGPATTATTRPALFEVDNASTANGQPGFFMNSVTYTARGQTDLITYGNGATANFTYDLQRGWLDRVLTRKGTPS